MADRFFLDTMAPDFNAQLAPLIDAMNGEDPLPCALICAAYIDKCLGGILDILFIKGSTREKLLEPDLGLIGTIQNRANILYLLGHIRKPVFQNIGHICMVRNKFAHSTEQLSFESELIVDCCNKLQAPMPAATFEFGEIPESIASDIEKSLNAPRRKFTWVTMLTVSELASIASSLAQRKAGNDAN